eukprot:jgi/Mesvir1/2255/Mv19302-RA.1
MGVAGLKSLLERRYRPGVISICAGELVDSQRTDKVLLVNGASVLNYLRQKLSRAAQATPFDNDQRLVSLYHSTCTYFTRLQSTGLDVLVVQDSAPEAGQEEHYVESLSRSLETLSGFCNISSQLLFEQALEDVGVQCIRSARSASSLLLSWYLKYEKKVFAVLTDEIDLLLFGVERLVLVEDTVVDARSLSFHLWSGSAAWTALKRGVSASDRGVSLEHRAQVAALLGGDIAGAPLSAPTLSRSVPAPVTAAMILLASDDDMSPLSLKFFQHTLGLRSFPQSSLDRLLATAEAVESAVRKARSAASDKLKLGPLVLPHVRPDLVPRLAQLVVPHELLSLATRGMACPAATKSEWSPLVPLLYRAAQLMWVAGAAADAEGSPLPFSLVNPHGRQVVTYTAPPASKGSAMAAPAEWAKLAGALRGFVDKAGGAAPEGADKLSPGTSFSDALESVRAVLGDRVADATARACARFLQLVAPRLAGDDDDDEDGEEDVRELLFPFLEGLDAAGAASSSVYDTLLDATVGGGAADKGDKTVPVEVGSSLKEADWNEIDNKDVVAKTKMSPAFRLMEEIEPLTDDGGDAAPSLSEDVAWEYFYVQRKENDTIWRKLAKACFPERYAAASEDKSVRGDLKNVDKASILENLQKAARAKTDASAGVTLSWLTSLGAYNTAAGMLAIKRAAIAAKVGSVAAVAGRVCWEAATPNVRREALAEMFGCGNKLSAVGKPRRYRHQEDLVRAVDRHLTGVETALRVGGPVPMPLQIILSTPTGSGKTFTAVMLQMQCLKSRHPKAILLYSVPTKMVLKRVGQSCEAHKIVYWSASKNGDLYQVRRPYSIRTKKGEGTAGTGTMKEQLDLIVATGARNKDRGTPSGRPDMIVADLQATAALLATAQSEPEDSYFHTSKIVLYFDEPNMGIHLDKGVLADVQRILSVTPHTTMLTSATLPGWNALPSFWKGQGKPATRMVITQEPYGLPMSRLLLLADGLLAPVSVLDLFPTHKRFLAAVHQDARLRVLLLRHITPEQGVDLINLGEQGRGAAGTAGAATNGGASATDGSWADDLDQSWMALHGDVSMLREDLEPALMSLDAATFYSLRSDWRGPTKGGGRRNATRLRDVFSSKGIMMIAAIDAQQTALELAGKPVESSGEAFEAWMAEVHSMKKDLREAERQAKTAEKESARSRKKTDEDEMGAGAPDASAGTFELRQGLSVRYDECEATDPELLVMLRKGIVFASSGRSDPLVARLYQQALLHVPEEAIARGRRLPPIHVLVVDYSSVYGTDCPGVDTIVMTAELGRYLSWDDHQQFLGRLRRDGQAVYMSREALRRAAVGTWGDSPDVAHVLPAVAAKVHTAGEAGAGAGEAALVGELTTMAEEEGREVSDMACAVLGGVLGAAAASRNAGGEVQPEADNKKVLGKLQKLVRAWRPVIRKLTAGGRADRLALVAFFQRVCEGQLALPVPGGSSGGVDGARFMPLAMHGLKMLYDEDVLLEEDVLAWGAVQRASGKAAEGAFQKAGMQLVQWLEEASEEESDDDEEEED